MSRSPAAVVVEEGPNKEEQAALNHAFSYESGTLEKIMNPASLAKLKNLDLRPFRSNTAKAGSIISWDKIYTESGKEYPSIQTLVFAKEKDGTKVYSRLSGNEYNPTITQILIKDGEATVKECNRDAACRMYSQASCKKFFSDPRLVVNPEEKSTEFDQGLKKLACEVDPKEIYMNFALNAYINFFEEEKGLGQLTDSPLNFFPSEASAGAYSNKILEETKRYNATCWGEGKFFAFNKSELDCSQPEFLESESSMKLTMILIAAKIARRCNDLLPFFKTVAITAPKLIKESPTPKKPAPKSAHKKKKK